MGANKVLIADDVEVNRSILKQLFRYQYEVLEAANGIETVELVHQHAEEINIILLDVVMPEMDGFGVLEALKRDGYLGKIPVVLITGDVSKDVDERGYEYGVADIVRKPFEAHIVRRRIRNVIELYRHQNRLKQMVDEQTEKLRIQAEKLQGINERIIDTISAVVEYRNAEPTNHIRMIKQFTRLLCEYIAVHNREYRLTQESIERIVEASALHDIGKIAIPDSVLLKPGRLTEDEEDMMRLHTVKGCEILKSLGFMEDKEFYDYCIDICMHHHESYDGKGYPEGLKGNDISIAAQIVAFADAYDTLVREWAHRKELDLHKIASMILAGEYGVFSPVILDAFHILERRFEEVVMQPEEAEEDGKE